MAPMIETAGHIEEGVAKFYDRLAPDYDDMTGFAKRFIHEKPFFRLLVDNHNIHTAMDAGAGTGFHSLLLAQLGVHVTSVDFASEMLQRLDAHAKQMGLHVNPVQTGFRDLLQEVHAHFDAVFCMGNVLAHDLTKENLQRTIQQFSAVLRPRGILFAQVLNYERILAERERVQHVKEKEGVTFIRFYDFESDFIRFNILRLRRNGDQIASEIDSIALRPVMSRELTDVLVQAGFENIKLFGGIAMEGFAPSSSRDLVVLAERKPCDSQSFSGGEE